MLCRSSNYALEPALPSKPTKHNTCEQSYQSKHGKIGRLRSSAIMKLRFALHFRIYDHLCEFAISNICLMLAKDGMPHASAVKDNELLAGLKPLPQAGDCPGGFRRILRLHEESGLLFRRRVDSRICDDRRTDQGGWPPCWHWQIPPHW